MENWLLIPCSNKYSLPWRPKRSSIINIGFPLKMVLWAMRSVWWISSQMLAHSVKGVTVSPVLELRFVRAVGLPCRWDCQSISLFGLLLDETSASLPSNGKVMPLELGGVFSVSLVLLLVLCFTALTTQPIISFEIFRSSSSSTASSSLFSPSFTLGLLFIFSYPKASPKPYHVKAAGSPPSSDD